MLMIGAWIDGTGTLICNGDSFAFRRDLGGRYALELRCTPAGLVEQRVRLIGTLVGDNLVNADGVTPA